ncbi:FAD-dependent oxidoreductase, partial [Escherichia coli]|nr:FAD-dependent oxidoreductase [Escherichia coli]
MSRRIQQGGRLIDRAQRESFAFNGRQMSGFAGDTLASALLANDQMMMGRSFKYHRPRGPVASGAEEPNALVGLSGGARFEPNQRTTTTEIYTGLTARSQNHWPSLDYDIGALNGFLSPFLPAGFYYKTFMHPRPLWKNLFEPVIRHSAGLGKAPTEGDADRYEHFYFFADVMIVGGGIAGLQAALTAGRAGAKVLLIEQTAHWGGRAPVDGVMIGGKPADDWIAATLDTLSAMDNVTLRTRTMGAGVYDHGYALAYERCEDAVPQARGPRHRLWRVRAAQIITATGAIERPLSFPGNDVPGVMLASAVRDYLVNWAVAVGKRTVIVTNNDDAYRTAIALHEVGEAVPVIVDARPDAKGPLPERARALGIRIEQGCGLSGVKGGKRVTGAQICRQNGAGA